MNADHQPTYSVIIANFNGADYLSGALASLAAQTERNFEIFVVDNASSDDSMACISGKSLTDQRLHGPNGDDTGIALYVLQQSENLGFAAANNLAAQKASGDWLVLLNPDAEASPTWLETLAQATQRHPGVSMFASAQICMHDLDRLDGAGDAYSGYGIPWRGGFGHPVSTLPQEGTCFSPCGAGAMIRRDVYLQHNGFDERFFCYCEDVDLGYRMRLAGETCVFLPDAVIQHAGSAISGHKSEFSMFHGTRNRLWTYVKNTPLPLLILTLPLHVTIVLAVLVHNWNQPHIGASLRGLKAGITGMGPFLRDRKALGKARKASLLQLAASMRWNPIAIHQRKPDVRPFKT